MKLIPSVIVPIIEEGQSLKKNLFNTLKNKKVVIFGVPGAFTPTCSEKHLPGFLELSNDIKSKGIDDIYCLSVNDPHVMKSWLLSYRDGKNIKGIADGNAEISLLLDLINDKTASFMGLRCFRFALIVNDNKIIHEFIEKSENFDVSSAKYILSKI